MVQTKNSLIALILSFVITLVIGKLIINISYLAFFVVAPFLLAGVLIKKLYKLPILLGVILATITVIFTAEF